MESISKVIGSGAINQTEVSEVLSEPWCEFLTVDVNLKTSACFEKFEWKCKGGINHDSMKMLNDEFNYFRGLFPLKVFITGPPCSGKTHFASKLSESYGIPHLSIKNVIDMGL